MDLQIFISQGSVATQLRCGGMFSNHYITHFPQNMPLKKSENRLILAKDMDNDSWLTFVGHPVYRTLTVKKLESARRAFDLFRGFFLQSTCYINYCASMTRSRNV